MIRAVGKGRSPEVVLGALTWDFHELRSGFVPKNE